MIFLYFLSLIVLSTGASIEEYDSIEQNTSDEDYDTIDPDISEAELMKMLEEMGYVVPDDNTMDDLSGISDLHDLITGDNTEGHPVDYEYLDIFGNDADTQLDYQEDQNYKMFVQKALDSSVKFENIYEEQRMFNIILLSGISLICFIVMFGLISLA